MFLALVVVLGSTELHGQATAGLQATEAVRIAPFVQAQLGVAREFAETTLAAQVSVVLRFEPTVSMLSAQDLGSSLEVRHRVVRGWTVSVKLVPLNSNVVLPTSDWANRWGRGVASFNPVLVVALDAPAFRAWLALRPSVEFTRPLRWNQAVFAGAASTSKSGLRFDVRLGGLDYGKLDNDPLSPSPSRFALLANALAGWVWNEDVGPALDFTTYVNDPARFERFFAPEPARHARALRLTLEGGLGGQWLPVNGTVMLGTQQAAFVDLQARARFGFVRLFATGRIRTATQVNFDFANRVTDDGQTLPELTAIFGADVKLGESGVRPGVLVRFLRPATPKVLESELEIGDAFAPSIGAPHFSVKASVSWLLGNIGVIAGEVEVGTTGVRWLVLGQVKF